MSKDMPSSEDEKSNHFLERSPRIRVTIRGLNFLAIVLMSITKTGSFYENPSCRRKRFNR
jgi:hypothetical protein